MLAAWKLFSLGVCVCVLPILRAHAQHPGPDTQQVALSSQNVRAHVYSSCAPMHNTPVLKPQQAALCSQHSPAAADLAGKWCPYSLVLPPWKDSSAQGAGARISCAARPVPHRPGRSGHIGGLALSFCLRLGGRPFGERPEPLGGGLCCGAALLGWAQTCAHPRAPFSCLMNLRCITVGTNRAAWAPLVHLAPYPTLHYPALPGPN